MRSFNSEKPFKDLPLLPLKIDLETPSILKECIEANKELAKLKIAERLIPILMEMEEQDVLSIYYI